MSDVQTEIHPGRLLFGICVIAGTTYLSFATLNYMLTPMLADLGLTSEQAGLALTIPSLAALLIVFLAGRLGDKLGHRRIIMACSLLYIVGAATVTLAQGIGMLSVGLFLQGIGVTAGEVVVIGLIAVRFPEPKSRAKAYALFGMALPTVYLIFPVVAGWLSTYVSWRANALVWVIGGFVMFFCALLLLPTAKRQPPGEMWTPLFAGLFCVGIVQFIGHAADYGLFSVPALASVGTMLVAFVLCTVFYRRSPEPSLSLEPMKNGNITIVLTVILLVPTLNTFFFVMVALEYMFGQSAFEAAVLMVPAQLASIIGAGFISDRLTEKLGVKRAGVTLLLILAAVMAIPLTFSGTTPMWWVLVYACIFGGVVAGAEVVALNALMSSAPDDEGGNSAAFEGSAEEIGIALGVVLMTALVFGLGTYSLQTRLEASGLPSDEAAQVFAEIQANSDDPAAFSAYSHPLPDGQDASDLEKEAFADGLKVNGVAGIVICLLAAGLFAVHRPQEGDEVEAYAEDDAEA